MTIRPLDLRRVVVVSAALAVVAASAVVGPASATHAARVLTAPPAGLPTAVVDPGFVGGDDEPLFAHVRAAGASFVRIIVEWNSVAPGGDARPNGFHAVDPNDPHYKWTAVDAAIRAASARGLKPIVDLVGAPAWAQTRKPAGLPDLTGPYKPKPADFGAFATAVATRYDGRHGLPRVRYWQAWNEANLNEFLAPLYLGGRQYAAVRYRQMVNAFADAVHAVDPTNRVIAGALSPFTVDNGAGATVGPMAFMRAMLCMSDGGRPRPTCSGRAAFDIWAIQPYTSGNAFHKAFNPNDVSLGDLAKMRKLLVAAAAAGHIVAKQPIRLWVTELAWDTNPPDTNAVPIALQARWVSEALWQCWRNGVDLVTWFMLRDQPFVLGQPFQSGLYFRGNTVAQDKRKPSFTAFRFPFVAYPRGGGRTYVWGRTPDSKPGTVVIQEKVGFLGYNRAGTLKANRYGIFEGYVAAGSINDSMRARVRGESSLDFALKAPPDRFVHPFG